MPQPSGGGARKPLPGGPERKGQYNGGTASISSMVDEINHTIAAQIRAEHQLAQQHAETAIEHARRAGALLLQVKDALAHGAWLPWLSDHCELSARQAQRYMRAAQGKPTTPRLIKSDTSSHLTAPPARDYQADALELTLEYGAPISRRSAAITHLASGDSIWIQPAALTGYYYVTKILPSADEAHGPMRPVGQEFVGLVLKSFGVPVDASWFRFPSQQFDANPWGSTPVVEPHR